jgi:long-chain acyl-CoA synthetase
MHVAEILFDTAMRRPDARAVWCNGRWTTYGEIGAGAASFAASLTQAGIASGDRVAILLENSIDYIIAHFGILAAGAVEVSLNTDLSFDDLRRILLHCEPSALVTTQKYERLWRRLIDEIPSLRCVITSAAVDEACHVQFHSLNDFISAGHGRPTRVENSTLASIVYTSGSTGEPKGVMLSHGNLVSNTRSIVDYLGLREDDRMMVVLPFHYIYGRSLLYTHFLSGGSLVLDNRFAFPAAILKTMGELEVTCFAGVPSTFAILLRKTDVRTRKFPRLRMVTQAGGAMAPTIQQEVVEVFAPARLWVMYGSTEAAPRLTYLEPGLLPSKWGSIGRAVPGVEVVIMGEDGQRTPATTSGELAARGPNIMLGYWKDPEGTAAVMRDGYYLTGDVGYEDADGCLFVTGRARDMIKCGGNRISAREIEDCLMEMTDVVEVAVIGIPDEILGEAIKAFVVIRGSILTPDLMRTQLERRLPRFKQPKLIEFVDRLPKNQAGKILKEKLRKPQDSANASGDKPAILGVPSPTSNL